MKLRSKAGFTLVELIVVIAILAILAGIAVPVYSGYINKAESAADMQALDSVNTAVQGLAAGEGAKVTGISVTDTKANDPDYDAAEANNISITVTTAPAVTSGIDVTAIEKLTGELDTLFRVEFKGASWSEDNGWQLS